MFNKLFYILTIIFLISTTLSSNAQTPSKSNEDTSNKVNRQSAVIDQQGDYFFIILDNEPNRRYLDTGLSKIFRENGMKIIVSGQKLPIPPNVRMAGAPFKVTMIEKDLGSSVLKTVSPTDKIIEKKPQISEKKTLSLKKKMMERKLKAAEKNVPSTDNMIEDKGTVKKKGEVFIIETKETIYVPKDLAKSYQKEGVTVIFSAEKLPMPPNVRMIGQPIEIQKIKAESKNKQLKKSLNKDKSRMKIR